MLYETIKNKDIVSMLELSNKNLHLEINKLMKELSFYKNKCKQYENEYNLPESIYESEYHKKSNDNDVVNSIEFDDKENMDINV